MSVAPSTPVPLLPRLIMIPGMGTDHRLFAAQKEVVPDLEVLRLGKPLAGESLADYAARLAGAVPTQQPYLLGGVSMGGMLALELAGKLTPGPRAVVLIASCRHPGAIPASTFRMGRVICTMPDLFIRLMRDYLPPPFAHRLGPVPPEIRDVARAMYRETSVAFFRWAGMAIMRWPGVADPGVPVEHLHGDQDQLIRSSHVQPTQWLEGAGHLPTFTHPQAVNTFLLEALARHAEVSASSCVHAADSH